jgi:hypothetical protein
MRRARYQVVPGVQLSRSAGADAVFSWEQYRPQVRGDIQVASQAE